PLAGYLAATGTFREMVEALRALSAIYSDLPPELFPKLFPFTAQSEALRMNPLLVVPGLFNAAFMWDATYQYLVRYTAWMDALVRVVYYAPIAVHLAAAVYLARRLWRRTWSPADDATLLVLLVSAGLFITVIPHPAVHYLLPTQVQASVLAAVLAARAWSARQ